MTNLKRTLTTLALTSITIVGCGGDDDGDGVDVSGVYAIDSYQLNEAGCDTPGDTVETPNSLTHLLLYRQSFFGQSFYSIQSFDSEQAARDEWDEILADPNTLNLSISELGFAFDTTNGSSASGTTAVAFSSGDACQGTVEVADMMVVEDVLTVDNEITEVSGFARDSDDFCDTDAAIAQAETTDCSGREVVTATFVPAP